MIKFIRLLNFEWNRISKFLIGLLIFVFVVQIGAVVFSVMDYKRHVVDSNLKAGMSPTEIMQNFGVYSAGHYTYDSLFLLPIGIGIAAISFYIFFIWYRDWLGKNTFIYRLLMLPISRMKVYFAKLTTILLATLTLALMQYVYLHIYKIVIKLILPSMYRDSLSLVQAINNSHMLFYIPTDMLLFIFAYAIGTLIVMVLFTFILLERSFKLAGIMIGSLYIFLVAFIAIGPFMLQVLLLNELYLYPGELVLVYIVLWAILMFVTLLWNKKLMKQKITV